MYKFMEWRCDSLHKIIGVDPHEACYQYEYHRRQGLDPHNPHFYQQRNMPRDPPLLL